MNGNAVRAIGCCLSLMMVLPGVSAGQTDVRERPAVALENQSARVVYDLAGGSLADFYFLPDGLNPFTWSRPRPGDLMPHSMGHFICFDRWGPSSDTETAHGMPWHGEATSVVWTVDEEPAVTGNTVHMSMTCTLPLAGMTLTRAVVS